MRALLVSIAIACLLVGGSASGQGLSDDSASASGGPPPWAYSMAHDLMSPFCPGRTLSACPSPQADQLRQWILFQAAAGQSQEQIEEILYERFGDVLLSAPKAEGGWGVSAYAIPIVGFLLGGAFVAFMIMRLARGRSLQQPPAPVAAARQPTPLRGPASAGPALSEAEIERLVDEEFAHS